MKPNHRLPTRKSALLATAVLLGAVGLCGCGLESSFQPTPQQQQREYEAQIQSAIAAYATGDIGRAEQAIHAAVDKRGGSSIAYQEVGSRLIDIGRHAPAARLLEEGTQKNQFKRDPMVWAMLAKAQRHGGNTSGAADAETQAAQAAHAILQTVGTRKPDNRQPTFDAASDLIETGTYYSDIRNDLPQASIALEEAVRLLPESPMTLNALGYTLLDRGDASKLPRAEVLIRHALRLAPDDPGIQDSLGWLLYKKKDFAGARSILRDAVESDPDQPELRYHLGMAVAALGQNSDAIREFDRALVMRPGYPNALTAKQRLHPAATALPAAKK